jgi:S1-C subfamily serine protease
MFKRLLLSSLLALSVAASAFAADWTSLVPQFERSVVYIESEKGSCSGFVVNDAVGEKGATDYVLTAAHCEGKEVYVDQVKAFIKTKDVKSDLMILEVMDLDRPAVKFAKVDPKVGDEVGSYGYGYGLEKPMFRVTHISSIQEVPEVGGTWVFTDATFVPGQSGGPVFNTAGEVSMIVQMGSNSVGLGKGVETIKAKLGKYFKHEVKK